MANITVLPLSQTICILPHPTHIITKIWIYILENHKYAWNEDSWFLFLNLRAQVSPKVHINVLYHLHRMDPAPKSWKRNNHYYIL